MSEHDMNNEKLAAAIKSQFMKGIMPRIEDAVDKEVNLMISGFILAMVKFVSETKEAALDSSVADKIAAHYEHARAKHPYFADRILDNFDGGVHTALAIKAMADNLAAKRAYIKTEKIDGMVKPTTLLECEMAEVHEAYARGDTVHAVEECYDAIAVLLRMIDVLEGRQALGDPEKEDADKEGDDE